jgi:hypothetical protein
MADHPRASSTLTSSPSDPSIRDSHLSLTQNAVLSAYTPYRPAPPVQAPPVQAPPVQAPPVQALPLLFEVELKSPAPTPPPLEAYEGCIPIEIGGAHPHVQRWQQESEEPRATTVHTQYPRPYMVERRHTWSSAPFGVRPVKGLSICFIIVVLVIIAALGGGLGGALVAQSKKLAACQGPSRTSTIMKVRQIHTAKY